MSDVNLNTFKCPKCGATVNFKKNEEFTTCEFCGATLQVPKSQLTTKQMVFSLILILIMVGMALSLRFT